jgi:hypothetical protein
VGKFDNDIMIDKLGNVYYIETDDPDNKYGFFCIGTNYITDVYYLQDDQNNTYRWNYDLFCKPTTICKGTFK